MNVIKFGLNGFMRIVIFASSGVLSPFLLLHGRQAVIRLLQSSSPPLDLGLT